MPSGRVGAYRSALKLRREALVICMQLFAAPDSSGDHEHDLACYASLPEQLLRVSCLGERKSLRDERLDLFLLKEVKQGDQILSKEFRFQPFERLDAVGDHPFPAWEKPAAGDVQPEDGGSAKALTTTWTT